MNFTYIAFIAFIALLEKQALKQGEIEFLTQEMQKQKIIAEGLDTWVARYDALGTMERKSIGDIAVGIIVWVSRTFCQKSYIFWLFV